MDPVTEVRYPGGSSRADQFVQTTYRDGTTLSVEKFLVSNEGRIIDLAEPETLPRSGEFNMEFVIESNRFQGRRIDLLIAPEIFNQTRPAGATPDQLEAE